MHLARLTDEMLDRYRAGLKTELSNPERLAEVYGTEFAGADFRQQASNVATMATQMLDAPNAMVSAVTADKVVTAAAVGKFGVGKYSVNESYCSNVIGAGREFAVEDSTRHPLVCNMEVTRSNAVVSYLGVPILNNNQIVGVLCVFDDQPRKWTLADVSILTHLATVLMRARAQRAQLTS